MFGVSTRISNFASLLLVLFGVFVPLFCFSVQAQQTNICSGQTSPLEWHSDATRARFFRKPLIISVRDTAVVENNTLGHFGPYGSISSALKKVAYLRRGLGRYSPIIIDLGAGLYRFDQSLVIDASHSAGHSFPLIIRGRSNGSTLIRGSIQLKKIAGPPSSVYSSLAPNAAKYIRTYRWPEPLPRDTPIDTPRVHYEASSPVPFEVFDADGVLSPARWPNHGWARIETVGDDGQSLSVASPHISNWKSDRDLWVGGYLQWNWAYENSRVARVDEQQNSLILSGVPKMGLKSGGRVIVYNALSELDSPGEWYRDPAARVLLLWPRSEDSHQVEASISESAFVLRGASNVTLLNLTIERFRGDAVRIEGGCGNLVLNSTIRWTGARGVFIANATQSGVLKSTISDTGDGGVVLAGGDRISLEPARLFVRNCSILRFARLGHTFKPGVQVLGVGNTVSENVISGSEHSAIIFQGNDHLIELNDISDVVNDSTDSGAIYTGRDWSSRGTIIRQNFLHDLRPAPGFEVKGIYLDDFASGISVTQNLFLRVDQPVFIGGGRDNLIDANIFIDSSPAVHLDGRGLTWQRDQIVGGSEISRNLTAVPYQSDVWRLHYPYLASILQDNPAVPKRNRIIDNFIIGGEDLVSLPEVDLAAQTTVSDHILSDSAAAAMAAPSAAAVADILDQELRNHGLAPLQHVLKTKFRKSDLADSQSGH